MGDRRGRRRLKEEEERRRNESSLLRGSIMNHILYHPPLTHPPSPPHTPHSHTPTPHTPSPPHTPHSHTPTPHTPTHRVFPYLCRSVRNFVRDRGGVSVSKEFYVAFEDVPTRHKYVEHYTYQTTQHALVHNALYYTSSVHMLLYSCYGNCVHCDYRGIQPFQLLLL